MADISGRRFRQHLQGLQKDRRPELSVQGEDGGGREAGKLIECSREVLPVSLW